MTAEHRRWLVPSHHVLTETVPGSPEAVRDFYCDFDNLARLHPLVAAVQLIDDQETADGRTRIYRIRDRVPVGPLVLPIAYTARISVPLHGDVLTEARQFPRVRLRATVAFELVDDVTRVTERLTVVAPRPLAALTAGEAVKAHVELLAGIRRCFEQPSPNSGPLGPHSGLT